MAARAMASKSRERKRRPTLAELDKLLKHFFEMQRPDRRVTPGLHQRRLERIERKQAAM